MSVQTTYLKELLIYVPWFINKGFQLFLLGVSTVASFRRHLIEIGSYGIQLLVSEYYYGEFYFSKLTVFPLKEFNLICRQRQLL